MNATLSDPAPKSTQRKRKRRWGKFPKTPAVHWNLRLRDRPRCECPASSWELYEKGKKIESGRCDACGLVLELNDWRHPDSKLGTLYLFDRDPLIWDMLRDLRPWAICWLTGVLVGGWLL